MKKAAMFFQIFTIAMCFALIFTECTPIASDGGENPSNPGSPISPSNPSTMSIDEAIAKINALGANETLDVVLGSDTTQAVFANKNAELNTALKNCQGKVKLDMSKTDVTSIMDNAFKDCSSLASVTIGNGVTRIEGRVFIWCISLASVVIPDSVKYIGQSAFYNCTSLTSVDIPDSVTIIHDEAFYSCVKLDKINYAGTKDDWNTKITRFGSDWKSRLAPAAGVTCSDGYFTFASDGHTLQ